jgi:uncharacterized membrane protein
MTDAAPKEPGTSAPTPAPPPPKPPGSGGPGWIKIALAISVALNLAVAGLVAGAWLREGRDRSMPREMSFGPFTDALSDADRRELRRAFGDRMPGFRDARREFRDELSALLVTLRADPFDPAAAEAALTSISRQAMDRLDLGRDLIAARIIEMSDSERLAFAERLERGLKRR